MKTALVTGVSKGIGREITKKLSSEGYFIHGTYNTSSKEADELRNQIKDIELHQIDFSDTKKTLAFIQKIKDKKFDVLVNNAGVINFEKFDELNLNNWDKVFKVNVHAPFLLAHGLRDSLNKGAVIINIASTDGYMGSFVSISYSATKAALINLTKSLGNVYGAKGIRVVAIAPGWVGSGMDSPAIKEAMANNPMGRNAEHYEIANVVSFLVSDKASFINGTTIVVDGGYTNVDPILKKEAESL